jgi:hypothetical protein
MMIFELRELSDLQARHHRRYARLENDIALAAGASDERFCSVPICLAPGPPAGQPGRGRAGLSAGGAVAVTIRSSS